MKKHALLALSLSASLLAPSLPVWASDITGHWAQAPMEELIRRGVLKGTAADTYEPNRPVTRAEFSAMVARHFSLQKQADLSAYTDVSSKDWFADSLSRVVAEGLLTGVSKTSLAPQAPLTRQDAVVLVARLIQQAPEGKDLSSFEDHDEVSSYAKSSFEKMVALGVVEGENNHLYPKRTITRAEAAKLLLIAEKKKLQGSVHEVVTLPPSKPAVKVPTEEKITFGGSIVGLLPQEGKPAKLPTPVSPEKPKPAPEKPAPKPEPEKPETPSPVEPEEIPDVLVDEHTKIVRTGWAQYVAMEFTEGSLKDHKIFVDGVEVTEAVTPVTDDGRIAKWELTSLNPGKIRAVRRASEKDEEEIVLSDNTSPTPPTVRKDTDPFAMKGHITIPLWDALLPNFNDNGQPRVHAEKTTIDVYRSEASSEDIVARFYSPDTQLTGQETGEVEVLFSREFPEEQEWFDAVQVRDGSVALVESDGSKRVINPKLGFQKDITKHGKYDVGRIRVAFPQSNFLTNGRFMLRIRSEGHKTAFVPIHIVSPKQVYMRLDTPSHVRSGDELVFLVDNLTYGIQMPISRFVLTDPTGEEHELRRIYDYYLLGEELFFYNDVNRKHGRNNIPYKGEYTVTIYPDGYNKISTTFTVHEGKEPPATNPTPRIDAMTRATRFGGYNSGGSGGAGVGGAPMRSVDLFIDGDLIANAILLKELGCEHPAIPIILAYWETMSHDQVYGEHRDTAYEWLDYVRTVEMYEKHGKYLPFADYAPTGKTDFNRSYTSKDILQDGLLGDLQFGSEKGAFPPNTWTEREGRPSFTFGEDERVIVNSSDPSYLEKINEVIFGNQAALAPSAYSIVDGKLSIDASSVPVGTHDLFLRAPGYKTLRLYVEKQKNLPEVTISPEKKEYPTGKEGVKILTKESEGIATDFLKNLRNVYVIAPGGEKIRILTAEESGTATNQYFNVANDGVFITAGNFTKSGVYQVVLEAKDYGEKRTEVTLVGEGNTAPTPLKVHYDKGVYTLEFGDSSQARSWAIAINELRLNEVFYNKQEFLSVAGNSDKYKIETVNRYGTDVKIFVGDKAKNEKENTLVIKATGYEDLRVELDAKSENVTPPSPKPEVPAPTPTPAPEKPKPEVPAPTPEKPTPEVPAPTPAPAPEKPEPEDPTSPPDSNLKPYPTSVTTFQKGSFFSDPKLSWSNSGAKEDVQEFFSHLKSVKANGKVLERRSNSFDTKPFSYDLRHDSADQFIAFSQDVFTSGQDNILTFEAEGYRTWTFIIHPDNTFEIQ